MTWTGVSVRMFGVDKSSAPASAHPWDGFGLASTPSRCRTQGCAWRGPCPDHDHSDELDPEFVGMVRQRPLSVGRKTQRQAVHYDLTSYQRSPVTVRGIGEVLAERLPLPKRRQRPPVKASEPVPADPKPQARTLSTTPQPPALSLAQPSAPRPVPTPPKPKPPVPTPPVPKPSPPKPSPPKQAVLKQASTSLALQATVDPREPVKQRERPARRRGRRLEAERQPLTETRRRLCGSRQAVNEPGVRKAARRRPAP